MSKLVPPHKNLTKFFFLFLLLMLAFNYPILSIFNVPQKVGSFPLLYLYIFVVWLVAIVCIAIVFERHHSQRSQNTSDQDPQT